MLEAQKTDLSRRYVGAVAHLKASQQYLTQSRARASDRAASSSRHLSRHAAGQSHGAGNRARGVGRHRARRQHRDPAPQHPQHLHRGRTARAAGAAPTSRRWRSAARSERFHRSNTDNFHQTVGPASARPSSRSLTSSLRGDGHSCCLTRGWDLTRGKPGGCHEYGFQHQTGGGTGCHTGCATRQRSGRSSGRDRTAAGREASRRRTPACARAPMSGSSAHRCRIRW